MEYDAMRMADGPTPNEERIAHLEGLLSQARWYVKRFEPTDYSEAYDRDMLMGEIDIAMPEPDPQPRPPTCEGQYCTLPKGHEGPCDDIPF